MTYREEGEREGHRAGGPRRGEVYDEEGVGDRVEMRRDRGYDKERSAALVAVGHQRSGRRQPDRDEEFSEEEEGGRGRDEHVDRRRLPSSFRRPVPTEGYEDEEDMRDKLRDGGRRDVVRDGKKRSENRDERMGAEKEDEGEDARGQRAAEGVGMPARSQRDHRRAGSYEDDGDQDGDIELSHPHAAKFRSSKHEDDYDDEKMPARRNADSGRQLSFSKQGRETGGGGRPTDRGRETGRSFKSGASAGAGRSSHDGYDRARDAERKGGDRDDYLDQKPFRGTGAGRERKEERVYDEEDEDYERPEGVRKGVLPRRDEPEHEVLGHQGVRANGRSTGEDDVEVDTVEEGGLGTKRKHFIEEEAFGVDAGGEGRNKTPGGMEEPATSEERREMKRRKKEEKRVKKEENRKRKEEKRKRKEEKRAAKEAMKGGGILAGGQQQMHGGGYVDEEGDDDEEEDDDMEGSGREEGLVGGGELRKGGDLRRLEEELRQKALESLKAKKA